MERCLRTWVSDRDLISWNGVTMKVPALLKVGMEGIQSLVDRMGIPDDDGEDAMRGKGKDRKGQVENDGQEKRNNSWMMNWMPFLNLTTNFEKFFRSLLIIRISKPSIAFRALHPKHI